jgi:hypothetical protein
MKTLLRGRISIVLLLLLSVQASFSATFTWGTSGAPSDPPWTETRAGLSQTANTLVSTSAFGLIRYNAATFTQGQFVEAAFAISSADIFNGQQMLYLRFADTDNYIQIDFDDGRHSTIISSRIAGADNVIATITLGGNFVLGDIAKADITTAGLITVYRNGSSYGTYDAAAINATLTGNTFGIGMRGATTDMGAWGPGQGGDLGGGGATNFGGMLLRGAGR